MVMVKLQHFCHITLTVQRNGPRSPNPNPNLILARFRPDVNIRGSFFVMIFFADEIYFPVASGHQAGAADDIDAGLPAVSLAREDRA